MKLTVNGSTTYDIYVDSGIINNVGEYLSAVTKPSKIVVVSDDNVMPLYGEAVRKSLENSGFSVLQFVFPSGEASKNFDTLARLLAFLTENAVNRADMLLALGGGVVSDLTGFAASCYLRSIKYATVTTTMLAAVDASIGGKTAIDHAGQKNNVGAFYLPSLVVCDTDCLDTLDISELKGGIVEAIKTALLHDEELFEKLSSPISKDDYAKIIIDCLKIKKFFVEQDERDTGLRQLLNLGHTLGHAIEAESAYCVPHGFAVASGLVAITNASEYHGLTEKGTAEKIEKALSAHGIPYSLPYDIKKLLSHLSKDKKTQGSNISLALLKNVAQPFLHKVPVSELPAFFDIGC